ncbi:MAG: VTT domain-containing protein [Kiritimatiellae bacterium]|nr:VTT domain-containing protein [Kiritimatiellia bacterium]
MATNDRRVPWRLLSLALLLMAAILVPFVLWGTRIEDWAQTTIARGAATPWRTAAILCGLLAVDVVAPVPSSLISTACGAVLGFWGGLLASFAGMTLSVFSGLALGRGAACAARRGLGEREAAMLQRLRSRWGVWMLAAVRPVPVLAEASVIFAGVTRIPWREAAPMLLLANLAVSAVYAAIGAMAAHAQATLLAFLAAGVLSGAAMLAPRTRLSDTTERGSSTKSRRRRVTKSP